MSPPNKNPADQGGVHSQNKTVYCDLKYLTKFCDEVRSVGLQLQSTTTSSQCATLLKLLQYLGPRGVGTLEAHAAGYARLAARILDLQETWEIAAFRENVVDANGHYHQSMARYILIGRKADRTAPQFRLELDEVAA